MKQLHLPEITEQLEALEETIVFKLIDRAQFSSNAIVYKKGGSGFKGATDRSLFELRLRFQEEMDAQFGRFCVPEERPFNRGLPTVRRKVMMQDTGLHIHDYNVINVTPDIMAAYLSLVPLLCREGDDGQYGSSVEHDVYALQAISRRIHYGSLYVAECKFRKAPVGFGALIGAGDREGLLAQLTRKEVEETIIMRVGEKVAAAQATVNTKIRRVIDPEVVVRFYRDCIIPLTKKGEVLYLLNRREHHGV